MEKQWTDALAKMTYGIYVLTCKEQDRINGMIASWVTQVSHDPLLILTAVHPNRYSHALMEKGQNFALHVLAKSQSTFLKRFKGPVPEKKFSGIDWEYKKTGTPILKDCLAWFELEKKQTLKPGNHTLFIGEVVNAGTGAEGSPLCTLDYDGMYTGKN